jgi:LPPG:FO 2-phospho-L-lactate transferase
MRAKTMITALAGGVGAARFLTGLVRIVKEEDLTVIVNTGDDIELNGLYISPDADIITYTLSGMVDEMKGWGVRDDTFNSLEALKRFSGSTWFALGDRDLATHIYRTSLLRKGLKLSDATARIARAFGLKLTILPMTDDRFETRIVTREGSVHFEEYLVKKKAQEEVLGVEFFGADDAKPAEGVINAIENSDLIVVCPSNPIVSIGAILTVKGVREAIRKEDAKKVAVSPIVAGAPIKGPADKMLKGLGLEVSAYSVAKLYADFLDTFIIDTSDSKEKARIETLGVEVKVTNTIMKTLKDKVRLAKTVLESAG